MLDSAMLVGGEMGLMSAVGGAEVVGGALVGAGVDGVG